MVNRALCQASLNKFMAFFQAAKQWASSVVRNTHRLGSAGGRGSRSGEEQKEDYGTVNEM